MADEIRRLIRVRTRKGARFKRDGFGKKPQISDSWRKPRGQHNKQREQKKAKGRLPKPGFGSPLAVRGMHPSGFFEVLVCKIADLEGLDPETRSIRIAATVGRRKRAALQEQALAAGLRVLNARAAKKVKKNHQPVSEEKKKAVKQEPKKVRKETDVKKAKPKSAPEREALTEKKEPQEPRKEEIVPAKKRVQEKSKPESSGEEKVKEGRKKRAQKVTAADAAAEPKPKKTSKAKEEAGKEVKPVKKTAAKPKKKTTKDGEKQ